MKSFIQFSTTKEVHEAAKRLLKKIPSIDSFFSYNVLLQVAANISKVGGYRYFFVNYMPRKCEVNNTNDLELFEHKLTKSEFNDLMIVNAAVLKNLAKQFKTFPKDFKKDKESSIVYPNPY